MRFETENARLGEVQTKYSQKGLPKLLNWCSIERCTTHQCDDRAYSAANQELR